MKITDIITEDTVKKIDPEAARKYKKRGEKAAFTKWRRKPIDKTKDLGQQVKHAFNKGKYWGTDIKSTPVGKAFSAISNFVAQDRMKSTMR